MMWQDLVRETLRLAVGNRWRLCIIPDLEVLDLRDGAWLRLDENMLQLFPGTSAREGMVWTRGTPVEDIVAAVTGPSVPQNTDP